MVLPVLTVMSDAALYAHGVFSKEPESGKVRFFYDDDSPVAHGHISVYDKDGKEIATGQADAEGTFDYSKYENVGNVSVSDTHGHKRTHVIGEPDHADISHDHSHGEHSQSHDHQHGGNTLTVICVVVALLVVAALFYFGKRKNNNSRQK